MRQALALGGAKMGHIQTRDNQVAHVSYACLKDRNEDLNQLYSCFFPIFR
jgi:hypothetical protein